VNKNGSFGVGAKKPGKRNFVIGTKCPSCYVHSLATINESCLLTQTTYNRMALLCGTKEIHAENMSFSNATYSSLHFSVTHGHDQVLPFQIVALYVKILYRL
jgi:hypothetical protein